MLQSGDSISMGLTEWRDGGPHVRLRVGINTQTPPWGKQRVTRA